MSVDTITAKTNDPSDPSELDLDLDYDSFDEGGSDRPAERWAPLGAAVSPTPSPYEPRFVRCNLQFFILLASVVKRFS